MTPVTKVCHVAEILISVIPFVIMAMKIEPKTIPKMEPAPPFMLMPPMTAPAITIISKPLPIFACAEPSREAISTRRWTDVNPDPLLARLEEENRDFLAALEDAMEQYKLQVGGRLP